MFFYEIEKLETVFRQFYWMQNYFYTPPDYVPWYLL